MLRLTHLPSARPTRAGSNFLRFPLASRRPVLRQKIHHERVHADVLTTEELGCARRALLLAVGSIATFGIQQVPAAEAFSGNPLEYKKELKNRKRKVPESEYTDGPDGLKLYDIEVGTGAEASVGSRVAVHYEVKWRGITFMTSRMGLGVTGGNPLGFDVGTAAGGPGSTLAGLDLIGLAEKRLLFESFYKQNRHPDQDPNSLPRLSAFGWPLQEQTLLQQLHKAKLHNLHTPFHKGVRGMRVGGLRKLLVPPQLGYGNMTVGEIPPNSILSVDVELLSIKTNPFRSNAPAS